MKKFILICSFLFSVYINAQDTYTSTGTGGSWFSGSTWTCTGGCTDLYPGQSGSPDDVVIIANGTTVDVAVGTAVYAGSINIESGGTLTLSNAPTLLISNASGGSGILEIYGTLNAGDGTIDFKTRFFLINEDNTGCNCTGVFNRGTSTVRYSGATANVLTSVIRNSSSSAGGTNGHTLAFYNLSFAPSTLNTSPNNFMSISNGSTAPSVEVWNILEVTRGILRTNNNNPNPDNLTLKASSPTSYGRVALNDGGPIATRTPNTGTISGNVTMEHVFQTTLQTSTPSGGQYNGDWFQMSYPLEVADLASGWANLTVSTTGNASTQNFYYYDASVGTGTGANGADNAVGWTMATSGDNHSKPYTVFLASDAPFQASQTVSLTGTVNLADVQFNPEIYYTSDPNWATTSNNGADNAVGWSLLRNPWPSIIETETWLNIATGGGPNGDWDLAYPAVHVWNSSTGAYEAFSASNGGIPIGVVSYGNSSGMASGANYSIPPFQAFWVKTSSASEAAGGDAFLKKIYSTTTISPNVFQKTSTTAPEAAVLFAYDQDSLKDITLVYYEASRTKQFDYQTDRYKLMSIKPGMHNLYIEEGGSMAQSAGRPFAATDTVEVYYNSPKNGTAYLWLNDSNLTGSYTVTLYDKLTMQSQDMRSNPTYTFTHDKNNDADRFLLIINNSAFDIAEYKPAVKPMKVYTTGNELAIESVDYTGPAYITMFDMAGRMIMKRPVEMNAGVANHVQLPGMANSIYSVEIEFDGRTMVEKIIH